MRVYAIGDIHGHLDKLEAAHALIQADRARSGDASAPVVHLGDLVDRGPDSAGVIDYLDKGMRKGNPWIVLKGNHDDAFAFQIGLGAGREVEFRSWMSDGMGGRATIASYGLDPGLMGGLWTSARLRKALADAVPETHKERLSGLPTYYETSELIFVHAGIRPGLALSEQIEEDLLWIRNDFLLDRSDHGKLVVHGHTPVEVPMHCGNRINLDTGAGFGRSITAAVFEGRDAWILDPFQGRVPLTQSIDV